MYVKITNLSEENIGINYKGLDIDFIKAGTPLYNFETNESVFFYEGELIEHEDIHTITDVEYNAFYTEILNSPTPSFISPDEKIAELKGQINAMQEALDFLLMGGM